MVVTIDATKFRNDVFDILKATEANKQITEIFLNGKKMAKLSPIEEDKFDWDKYIKDQKKFSKKLKMMDWSYLKKFREEFDRELKW